jgi:hypothetical protein
MRAGAVSLLAALAVVAAGCGGGGGGGGNALPAAADVVPASAPVLISINTKFDSRQWRNALSLVPKFPDLPDVLRRGGRETGLNFERDVKPALGPEVDVVFLDFANDGNDVVGLTQPKNKAKLLEGLRKLDAADDNGSKTFTEDINGWTVIADARSKIDAFRRASSGDKLAEVSEFKDAMSRLDERSGVRAYVAGSAVQEAIDRRLRRAGAPPNLTRDEVAELGAISAAVSVEAKGVRTNVALTSDPAAKPKTAAPTLAESLPAGALLYISTFDLASPTRTILHSVSRINSEFGTQLRLFFFGALGLTLGKDVYPMLAGEQAFAVYAQTPIPKIVLLLTAPDEDRAKDVIARFLELLKVSGEFRVSRFNVGGVDVTDVTQPGASTHVYVAVADEKLIVSTSRDLLPTVIEGKGRKLADDRLYKQALTDAKVPAKVAGLVYVDLTHGLPFAFDLAEANGNAVPDEARTNTQALSHALLYAHQDGNRFLLSGFAAIK